MHRVYPTSIYDGCIPPNKEMSTGEETEFVRVLNLCRMFDCDRKTMERLLEKLAESHQVEIINWNGQRRVNYKQFRRAVLLQSTLTF